MHPAGHVARLLRLAIETDAGAADLRGQTAAYVNEAHSCGASWADVGTAFGITRQAAHERFHGVNRGSRRVVRHNNDPAESLNTTMTT
jgi:hypothetical protein